MTYDRAGYRDHCGDCRHFMIDAWLMQIRRYAYGVGAPAAYVNASDSLQNQISVAAGCVHYEKANGIDNEPNPKEN